MATSIHFVGSFFLMNRNVSPEVLKRIFKFSYPAGGTNFKPVSILAKLIFVRLKFQISIELLNKLGPVVGSSINVMSYHDGSATGFADRGMIKSSNKTAIMLPDDSLFMILYKLQNLLAYVNCQRYWLIKNLLFP